MTADESVVGGGRFGTDAEEHARLLAYARAWPHRVRAVEGCAGIGKHVADRLVADEASALSATWQPRFVRRERNPCLHLASVARHLSQG